MIDCCVLRLNPQNNLYVDFIFQWRQGVLKNVPTILDTNNYVGLHILQVALLPVGGDIRILIFVTIK